MSGSAATAATGPPAAARPSELLAVRRWRAPLLSTAAIAALAWAVLIVSAPGPTNVSASAQTSVSASGPTSAGGSGSASVRASGPTSAGALVPEAVSAAAGIVGPHAVPAGVAGLGVAALMSRPGELGIMSAETEPLKGEPAEVAERIVLIHGQEPSWLDECAEALDRARAGSPLERILEVWGLSQAEAARLFGVTRQAVGKWLGRGVPEDRVEAVADLAAATDLLVRHLERERIPAVVRRKAGALGGKSLLQLVASARYREVLEACRSMFEFERAHA